LAAVLSSASGGDAIYLKGGDGFGFAGNALTANVTLTNREFDKATAMLYNKQPTTNLT
jgi:hypothetical protein